jgi:hypothetical protein
MSCEITADSVSVTSVKRTIPILHRYSTQTIFINSGGGALITSNTTSAAFSLGTTGFVYQNGLYRNLSGQTLVCLVSYAVLWNNVSASGRMSWIQMDDSSNRYAMSCYASVNTEPCSTGSAIIVVPHNSYLRLWVYQNTGFQLSAVAQYGMPYLQIVII